MSGTEKHFFLEIIRINGPAQLVGDAPEGIAKLLLVGVGHQENRGEKFGSRFDELAV
ncbi:MAG: hypothetical protein KBF76_13100 [Verrucomicrobiales bacterium]|jgi:hypothetical protein|nr:hypothetical protein [Verrucomicrobiales bacterium]